MSTLEQALGELEAATLAMEAMDVGDGEMARMILKRRAKAIARLSDLQEIALALPAPARERVAERLRAAEQAGVPARRRLARSKRGATMEWSRWNQVRRALAPGLRAAATKIDCSG